MGSESRTWEDIEEIGGKGASWAREGAMMGGGYEEFGCGRGRGEERGKLVVRKVGE